MYKFIALLLLPLLSFSQKIEYGINLKYNLATQLISDPNHEEDGTTQLEYLKTVGVGVFVYYKISEKFFLNNRLNYMVKGFEDKVERGYFEYPTVDNYNFRNSFQYLVLDILPTYEIGKKNIKTKFYSGLQFGYLLDYKLDSDVMYINESYPINEYITSDFNKMSLGYIMGLGINVNDFVDIDLESNRDLTKTISKSNFEMKNWVWSLNLSIHLDDVLKK